MERVDPLLYSYQTAISSLMDNQQVALAAFLAASAMAHLPIQPEISPLESPQIPSRLGVAVRPRHRRAVRMRPARQVQQHPYQQRLRFILEREHSKRIERVESRGNCVLLEFRGTSVAANYYLLISLYIDFSLSCFNIDIFDYFSQLVQWNERCSRHSEL